MGPGAAIGALVAGFVAGGLNAVVGAGTLVSFPALLALGLSPVSANVTSSLGVLPGSVAGAYAYRHQLASLRAFLAATILPAAAGGLLGALLLLVLPGRVFGAVVPFLLVTAAGLVAAQPWVASRVARRRASPDPGGEPEPGGHRAGPLVLGAVLLAAVYGGYFGAGVSVVYLALLGGVLGGMQAANGAKNVLSATGGVTAAVVFAVRAPVDWPVVLLLAVGSTAGGLAGGRFGRTLPDPLLRATIIAIALVAAAHELLTR